MLKISRVISFSLLIIALAGCVRRPSNQMNPKQYNNYDNEISSNSHYLPSKSDIKRTTTKVAGSLPVKVKALADKVERSYKLGKVSSKDLAEWVELYAEYSLEYSCSLNKLSDAQCESIEYHLGRIAGYVYRDTVSPIMEELDEINKGLENYEERSQKWHGAAQKGFEDVTGVSGDDIFGD